MAEVRGIIGAVGSVAEVGFKLSISLYRYSHAVASSGKSIESVSSEVSLLSSVLQQLGSCLEQDEFVKLCKQQTLTTTKDIAEECKAAFEDLDDIIGKYVESGKLTLKDRLKWPFVEKKVTLLRVNLDRLKSTLMLMLEVLKYARSIVKHEQAPNGVDREIIIALKQANVKATQRYEKLLLAIESGSTTGNEPFANKTSSVDLFAIPSETDASPAYILVDKNGIELSQTRDLIGDDELLDRLKRVTTLIDQVDKAQADIMEMTQHRGIWEMSLGKDVHGNCHFRNTTITKHDNLPGFDEASEITKGAGSSLAQQSPEAAQSRIKDVYIALMGVVGCGKSSFINLVCGKEVAKVSHTLSRGTEMIGHYSFMYSSEVRMNLIDTPGFDDTVFAERDILKDLQSFMKTMGLVNIKLSGILFLHDAGTSRMEDQFRYLRILRDLLGDEPARKVILVTTKGNMLPEGRAMAVENEMWANDCNWRRMIQLGSRLIRHTGDKESAMRILNSVIQFTARVTLNIQQEMANEPVKLRETRAGKKVESDLHDMLQHKQRLIQLQADFQEALEIQDLEFQKELEIQDLEFAVKLERVNSSYPTSRHIIQDKRLAVQRLRQQQTELRNSMIAKFDEQIKEAEESFGDRKKEVTAIDSMEHTLDRLLLEYTTVSDDLSIQKMTDQRLRLEN